MSETENKTAIQAQAHLHHAYLLGLQLMVSTRKGPKIMGDWMFRLFRRAHLEKFRASFDKLGLSDLPHAVACAQYHVLSNNMGGVPVEYMAESDRKAWVRFRYPRWMYHGPTICGIPLEVSRGFLNGWYAHNGVSLNNPRLGFVCVSEDMTGEFGLCGYFREFDRDLDPDERLSFANDEMPPAFVEADQPSPPEQIWTELRLARANRNYALDYIRNGLAELIEVVGEAETRALGEQAARLIGLQYYAETSQMVGCEDAGLDSAADYLATMFKGMGDEISVTLNSDAAHLTQTGLRVARGLTGMERSVVIDCWLQLWQGSMSAQQVLKTLDCEVEGDQAVWRIGVRTSRG
jgi:hypothetical protein